MWAVLFAGSALDLRALTEGLAEGLTEGLTEELFEAIRNGNEAAIRRLLDRQPQLQAARDGSGRSGYTVSQLLGRPSIAELLVSRGYRRDVVETCLARDWQALDDFPVSAEAVEQLHPAGDNAMSIAARLGIGNDVWRLYNLGGTPNRCVGTPPVVAAFDDPDLSRAELTAAGLLSNGASPDLSSADGTTALHAASRRGSADIVELLLRLGADPAVHDAEDHTPLDILHEALSSAARSDGHQTCLSLLERPSAIAKEHSTSRRAYDAQGHPYRAPELEDIDEALLYRAVGVSHGNLEALSKLLKQEPRLAHAIHTTTEGAVEACAHTGRLEIVDLLLENGAPYSLPTAVVRGDLWRAKALLDEDPQRIHERGAHSFALLWYSVFGKGSIEMAQLLLERGCQVEDQHFLGTTALHWAALVGDQDLVSLLIENGGNPRRSGRKFGGRPETPIDLARKRGHKEVVAQLERS